jgi:CheY-like chemotaxis protein/tRNA A-37 threonylcarbamoyl transferase component Bud32
MKPSIMLQRILIIDDSEEVEVLVRFCAQVSWPGVVLEMYDPRCGLPEVSFNWSRYDLLLLDYDLGLPDQNGLDWLVRLSSEPRLPCVIMMTGYASEKLAVIAREAGVQGFIDKNKMTPEVFSQIVHQAMEAKREALKRAVQAGGERTEYISPEDRQKLWHPATGSPATAAPVDKARSSPSGVDQTRTAISPAQQTAAPRTTAPAGSSTKAPVLSAHKEAPAPTVFRTTTTQERKARQPSDISIVVPGYAISKKIGQGGMASIYLAERDEDNIKVVLKVLSLKQKEDSMLLRRFMREYKLIGQIEHPNIVQIYERAFASDFAYIAMEYFGYGDLSERLHHSIDGRTAIQYLHQIAEGLGAAHAKGIVHRDMKPANILFRSEHELAITDFGIAKEVESDTMAKQLTVGGALLGTLYYISPEQVLGGEADQRSDLYSLGIIMYKMLTGKHPYTGTSPAQIFEGHINAPIPVLPPPFAALQPLLDGLLAKDPNERFQSTEDLLMGINWKEWR